MWDDQSLTDVESYTAPNPPIVLPWYELNEGSISQRIRTRLRYYSRRWNSSENIRVNNPHAIPYAIMMTTTEFHDIRRPEINEEFIVQIASQMPRKKKRTESTEDVYPSLPPSKKPPRGGGSGGLGRISERLGGLSIR